MTPADEAREAVDETDLDDLTALDWCVCRDRECVCEERRNHELGPAQIIAFVWCLLSCREVGHG